MAQPRNYYIDAINLSKHGNEKDGGNLLKALESERAFDSADYKNPLLQDKHKEQIEEFIIIYNSLKIPPTNTNERELMIERFHGFFNKIAADIQATLKDAVKSMPDIPEDKLNNKIFKATQNYLFNLLSYVKLSQPISSSVDFFLADLTQYSLKPDPIKEFDKFYLSQLNKKCKNEGNFVPAITYMEMVDEDYFKKILRNNKDIRSTFDNLVNKIDRDSEKEGLEKTKSINEYSLKALNKIHHIDTAIDAYNKLINDYSEDIKNGYTALQGLVNGYEKKVEELRAERKKIITDHNTSKNTNVDAYLKLKGEIENGLVVDKINLIDNIKRAIHSANDRLSALNQIPKMERLVNESKQNKIYRAVKTMTNKFEKQFENKKPSAQSDFQKPKFFQKLDGLFNQSFFKKASQNRGTKEVAAEKKPLEKGRTHKF